MLRAGIRRTLTPSEVARGYIYISNDRSVRHILGTSFVCRVGFRNLPARRLDGSGRMVVGRAITRSLAGHELEIGLVRRSIVIKW